MRPAVGMHRHDHGIRKRPRGLDGVVGVHREMERPAGLRRARERQHHAGLEALRDLGDAVIPDGIAAVLARPGSEGAVRLGVPEDFAAYRLTKLLAAFSRSHPALRLDVRADQSANLKRDLERGELDLALFKRAAGEKGGIAVWPERVHWVTSKGHPRDTRIGSVPLIGFPAGCLYRAGAIHALESAGRT